MADQAPMPHANATMWKGLSLGGALFLAGFMAWGALFGFGHGPSPGQQQASSSAQTTGQGSAAQPTQQKK